jgi:hypothetical protein
VAQRFRVNELGSVATSRAASCSDAVRTRPTICSIFQDVKILYDKLERTSLGAVLQRGSPAVLAHFVPLVRPPPGVTAPLLRAGRPSEFLSALAPASWLWHACGGCACLSGEVWNVQSARQPKPAWQQLYLFLLEKRKKVVCADECRPGEDDKLPKAVHKGCLVVVLDNGMLHVPSRVLGYCTQLEALDPAGRCSEFLDQK